MARGYFVAGMFEAEEISLLITYQDSWELWGSIHKTNGGAA